MAVSEDPGRNQKSRRRRTRPARDKRSKDRRASDKVAPLKVLNQAKPALADRGADDPLSPAEIAEMKEHFKFLRGHRKLLKLRLNAAEDLLLNGVREPTHRGVCQHLLAKVEKDRVLVVSERLAPPEAAQLLAGVLRFAPEMAFVLRFLKCVSSTSSQPDAARALAHALKRIEFGETSSAQMREILTLIVDVFPAKELPVLIFNWLDNGAFRKAFDRSSEALPEELGRLVLPLRTVHQALKGEVNGARAVEARGTPELAAGMRLLLTAGGLGDLAEPIRRRAFALAVRVLPSEPAELAGLERLFEITPLGDAATRGRAALQLVGVSLAAGAEQRALALLGQDFFEGESATIAKYYREVLAGPRVGPIALDQRGARWRRRSKQTQASNDESTHDRWLRGFHIPSQRRVRVRCGTPDTREEFAEQLCVWRTLVAPGVLRPLAYDIEGEQPYLAVELVGKSLRHRAVPASARQLRSCLELCRLYAATALWGVCLPDSDENRFSVDDTGRVWLVDAWGAKRMPADAALLQHLQFARSSVERLLERWGIGIQLEATPDFQALVGGLESRFS